MKLWRVIFLLANKEGPLASAPAFFILLALSSSIYLYPRIGYAALPVSLSLAAAFILIGTYAHVPNYPKIFLLLIVLSVCLGMFALHRMEAVCLMPDRIHTEGRVLLSRRWGKTRALLIDTVYGKVVAYSGGYIPEGAFVKFRGATFDFKRSSVLNGFDELLFWRARGAEKKVVLFDITETVPPDGIYRWKNFLKNIFREKLPPLSSAYLTAFIVGEREPSVEDVHRKSGTLHLLAVSGLHVGLLAWFVFALMHGRLYRLIVASAVLWLYVAMAGFPVGGVRAVAMAQLCMFSTALGRPSRALNNVSLAAAAMLLFNPWLFFDVGWRLSVLSALFVAASSRLELHGAAGGAVLSMLLWIVTAPVITYAFSETPAAGFWVNMIAVPCFSVIFPLLVILSVPSLVGLPFAQASAGLSEALLDFSQQALVRAALIFPFQIKHSSLLFSFSVVVFSCTVAYYCGFSKKASAIAVVFSMFFLLYCQSML